MSFRYYNPVKSIAELKMGQPLRTNGRTVCQCDLITFCGLIGDPHSLHLSKIEASQAPAGRIVASAPMIMSMAIGLMAQTQWMTPILNIFMGIENMRALKPVFPEDTIYCDVTPADIRETSSGKGSILKLNFDVFARRDNAKEGDEDPKVMTFTTVFLVRDPK